MRTEPLANVLLLCRLAVTARNLQLKGLVSLVVDDRHFDFRLWKLVGEHLPDNLLSLFLLQLQLFGQLRLVVSLLSLSLEGWHGSLCLWKVVVGSGTHQATRLLLFELRVAPVPLNLPLLRTSPFQRSNNLSVDIPRRHLR